MQTQIIPESAKQRTVILNIEDAEPTRFLRTRLFRNAGFNVVEAATAAEALSAVSRAPVSVALIDVRLPDSNGIALCDTVKRLHPQVPVVLISAFTISDDMRQASLAAGAYGCLGEPVSPEALLNNIQNALAALGESHASPAWVVTDHLGFILDASPEGAELLNGTVRGLHERNLLIFFDKDRETWRGAVARAVSGDRVSLTGRLRPKERRPLTVGVEIVATTAWDTPALRWRLTRIEADTEPAV